MEKTKICVPEEPKLYCSKCNREVFQTIHRAYDYTYDWYRSPNTNDKVVCKDCYKFDFTTEYKKSLQNSDLLGTGLSI